MRVLNAGAYLSLTLALGAQAPLFHSEQGWPIDASVLAADLTHDGVPECLQYRIFVASTTGFAFSYRSLRGNGIWADAPPQIRRTETLRTRFEPLVAADFNGDGHTDVFLDRWRMGQPPNELADVLLYGDGRGNMTDVSHLLPPTPTWLSSAHALDLDADQDLDIVAFGSSGYHVFVNDGFGRFSDETNGKLSGTSGLHGAAGAVLDVDLDGDEDLFVVNGIVNAESSVILVNQGATLVAIPTGSPPGFGAGVLLADADGDGHMDAVELAAPVFPTIWLATPGVPNMTAAPHLRPTWPSPWFPNLPSGGRSSAAADWDGDGDVDVMLHGGSAIVWWQNTGSGFVDMTPGMPQPLPSGSSFRLVVDYDLDGDTDLLLPGWNTPSALNAVFLSSNVREARTLLPPTRGGTYVTEFTARSNHAMLAVLGIAPANFHIPNLGWVFLDPAQSAFVGALHFPTHTALPLSIAVPNLPVLQGFAVGMQGLDIDLTTGAVHTTDRPSAIIQ